MRWLPIPILIAALTLPGLAGAQQSNIGVWIDEAPACQFSHSGIGVARIRVTKSFPFQWVRFKAPAPCGVTVLYAGSNFSMTGNIQTGVEVTLPSCANTVEGPVEIAFVVFQANTPVSNCWWLVYPADGDADIRLTDCDGYAMKGAAVCGYGWIAPYRPNPPDGTTDVPINTLLSFTGNANVIALAKSPANPDPLYDPACGTYPACSTYCSNPFDPGILEPRTTYRWTTAFVCWCCADGGGANSDTWTFTTGDAPLATEAATWGKIKSLYRQ